MAACIGSSFGFEIRECPVGLEGEKSRTPIHAADRETIAASLTGQTAARSACRDMPSVIQYRVASALVLPDQRAGARWIICRPVQASASCDRRPDFQPQPQALRYCVRIVDHASGDFSFVNLEIHLGSRVGHSPAFGRRKTFTPSLCRRIIVAPANVAVSTYSIDIGHGTAPAPRHFAYATSARTLKWAVTHLR